jgi:hypothetical protein
MKPPGILTALRGNEFAEWQCSEWIGRALSDVIIPHQNPQRVQPPKKPKTEAYLASAD